jgi:predicted PurR-regulated permease PerM
MAGSVKDGERTGADGVGAPGVHPPAMPAATPAATPGLAPAATPGLAPSPTPSPTHVVAAHRVRYEPRPTWVAFSSASVRKATIIVLALVVALWIGFWAFSAVSSFLFILLLAWLLSIAMEPMVLGLSDRGVKRGLATGMVMLGGVIIFGVLAEIFGSVFYAQLSELGAQLPSAAVTLVNWVNTTFHTTFDISTLAQTLQLTPDRIGSLAGTYGGGLLGIFGSVVTFLFDGLTILVFAYYFSADSPRLRQTIGSWMAPRYQRVFVTVWKISVEKTGGYVISKLVLAGLSALCHVIFFWAIDVPFWLPLGLLAGIVGQFIPTIGTYIGVALPALFTLVEKPINALWIAIFATVYQQIENYVFTPRVSRRTMDVHPAVALGSVIAGAALFGPIGALIGIPLAAVALSIINTFSARHELLPELAALEDAENGQDPEAKETVARADTDEAAAQT